MQFARQFSGSSIQPSRAHACVCMCARAHTHIKRGTDGCERRNPWKILIEKAKRRYFHATHKDVFSISLSRVVLTVASRCVALLMLNFTRRASEEIRERRECSATSFGS